MIYQDPKTASFALPIITILRAMARAALDLANRPGFRQQGRIFVEVQQPAIARIAEEVPAGTRLQAIIEVDDEMVEQPLFSAGSLDVRWRHRAASSLRAQGGCKPTKSCAAAPRAQSCCCSLLGSDR
jgi:hypothetical protein